MSASGRASGYVFGGLFLAFGLWLAVSRVGLQMDGIKAEGKVVEIETVQDSDGDTYRPVVEFTPKGASAPIRFTGSSTNPPLYQAGEKVTVVYRPSSPGGAKIHSAAELGMPFVVMLFGAAIASSTFVSQRKSAPLRGRTAFHEARIRGQIAVGVGAIGAIGGFVPFGLPGALRGLSAVVCFGGLLVAALFHSRTRNCPECGAVLGGDNGPPLFGRVAPCAQCGSTVDGAEIH